MSEDIPKTLSVDTHYQISKELSKSNNGNGWKLHGAEMTMTRVKHTKKEEYFTTQIKININDDCLTINKHNAKLYFEALQNAMPFIFAHFCYEEEKPVTPE